MASALGFSGLLEEIESELRCQDYPLKFACSGVSLMLFVRSALRHWFWNCVDSVHETRTHCIFGGSRGQLWAQHGTHERCFEPSLGHNISFWEDSWLLRFQPAKSSITGAFTLHFSESEIVLRLMPQFWWQQGKYSSNNQAELSKCMSWSFDSSLKIQHGTGKQTNVWIFHAPVLQLIIHFSCPFVSDSNANWWSFFYTKPQLTPNLLA